MKPDIIKETIFNKLIFDDGIINKKKIVKNKITIRENIGIFIRQHLSHLQKHKNHKSKQAL